MASTRSGSDWCSGAGNQLAELAIAAQPLQPNLEPGRSFQFATASGS